MKLPTALRPSLARRSPFYEEPFRLSEGPFLVMAAYAA